MWQKWLHKIEDVEKIVCPAHIRHNFWVRYQCGRLIRFTAVLFWLRGRCFFFLLRKLERKHIMLDDKIFVLTKPYLWGRFQESYFRDWWLQPKLLRSLSGVPWKPKGTVVSNSLLTILMGADFFFFKSIKKFYRWSNTNNFFSRTGWGVI